MSPLPAAIIGPRTLLSSYQTDGAGDRTFADIAKALGRQKLVIIGALIAALVVAIVYLHMAPRRYTASLGITPVSSGSSVAGQRFGGIASLAGIRLPGDESQTQLEVFLEGLTSRAAANQLAKSRPDLMKRLFAAEWDAPTRHWREPRGTLPSLLAGVRRLLGVDTVWTAPDGARLQVLLQNRIVIERDRDKRITVISIDTAEPSLGRDLLAALHASVDGYLRARALDRANGYVTYVREQLRTVTVDDYRAALLETMSQQEKLRMIANSEQPFAAEPFGPPSSDDRPSTPKVIVALPAAIVLGLFLGVVLAFIRDSRQRRRLVAAAL